MKDSKKKKGAPRRRPRMNKGPIYMTAKDLARLMGTNRMNTAYARHKSIREAIHPRKPSLTIAEYCMHQGEDFRATYYFLRGQYP